MANNILAMTEQMRQELDKFFAGKTVVDVDRNTFLTCNLNDNRLKITISLIFMRDWDSIEPDSYNSVIVENKGVVFTFPCYWISIPKELAMTYFEYIINDFYTKEVSTWSIASGYIAGGTTDNSTSTDNNNCNCTPTGQGQIQPCPYNVANI